MRLDLRKSADIRDRFPVSRPELAVFVSGTTSMGLEILAGRIIAPEYGSSIYTWGSIIGVFLTALSLGYYLGGKKAEKEASYGSLSLILLASSVYVALLIVLGEPLVRSSSRLPVPPRFSALPAVAVLFGVPVYLLGYISPYATEMSEKGKGEASGRVYAIGTAGSIIGVFGTTFFLIPSFSVNSIEFIFGLLLLLGAIGTYSDGLVNQRFQIAVVFVVLVASLGWSMYGVALNKNVVHHEQTQYQELTVIDSGGERTLYIDNQIHSRMYTNGSTKYPLEYTRYFHMPFLMNSEIDEVLFVGGGGFSGPRRFVDEYNVTVDVVELDPNVIETAKKYFRVNETKDLRIYQGDGREFLENTDKSYDLIIMDAFRKDSVPFHLTTKDFVELASEKLESNGILYFNVISSRNGASSRFYRSEYKTVSQVFPSTYSFYVHDVGPNRVQNIEIIATKNPTEFTEERLIRRANNREIGIDLSEEATHLIHEVKTDDVPVLFDDRAPVNRLMDPLLGKQYVVTDNENVTAG